MFRHNVQAVSSPTGQSAIKALVSGRPPAVRPDPRLARYMRPTPADRPQERVSFAAASN